MKEERLIEKREKQERKRTRGGGWIKVSGVRRCDGGGGQKRGV